MKYPVWYFSKTIDKAGPSHFRAGSSGKFASLKVTEPYVQEGRQKKWYPKDGGGWLCVWVGMKLCDWYTAMVEVKRLGFGSRKIWVWVLMLSLSDYGTSQGLNFLLYKIGIPLLTSAGCYKDSTMPGTSLVINKYLLNWMLNG